MTPNSEGSIRLFRFAGIDIFVHWSWLLLAYYSISQRVPLYSSPVWAIAEYLALFAIILAHEFGHSFACRQTGGQSEQIVLWPFGGAAYVHPPLRAGAQLWSIAAGPLVNVALVPAIFFLHLLAISAGWHLQWPDLGHFVSMIGTINLGLLIFNMLPIYPLDGGQILRSLLWFGIGPIRSLKIATAIGFVGVAGLGLFALQEKSLWMGALVFLIFLDCRRGWLYAQAMSKATDRHDGL
jgi:Zn-dependent protease